MAQPLVDSGTGTSLVFTTSSWTTQVNDIQIEGRSRVEIDTTHLASTAKTAIPGDLLDPGNLVIKFNFNPDSPPPMTATAEIVQIKFPLNGTITTSSNDKVEMFATDLSVSIGLEQKMEGTLKLRCTGTITHSNAA